MPDEKNFKFSFCIFYPLCSLHFVPGLHFVSGLRSAVCILGKISAQPHTTLCIQFLDRGNNDKINIVVGKTDLFYNSMGLCGNVLPHFVLTGIRGTNTVIKYLCVSKFFIFVLYRINTLSFCKNVNANHVSKLSHGSF